MRHQCCLPFFASCSSSSSSGPRMCTTSVRHMRQQETVGQECMCALSWPREGSGGTCPTPTSREIRSPLYSRRLTDSQLLGRQRGRTSSCDTDFPGNCGLAEFDYVLVNATQTDSNTQLFIEMGSDGKTGKGRVIIFQYAKVRKPLLAVSGVNDEGNGVWFDGESSCILPTGSAELAQIRRIIKGMVSKIPLRRKNGVFTMRSWRRKSDFARHVKQRSHHRPAAI